VTYSVQRYCENERGGLDLNTGGEGGAEAEAAWLRLACISRWRGKRGGKKGEERRERSSERRGEVVPPASPA
jgi:hypothetical protein